MQPEKYLDERGTECVHANTMLRPQSFSMSGNHCHSCYELYFVENGECCFLIEDNIHDLHAGDFILVPPMVLHYTRYPSSSCRRTERTGVSKKKSTRSFSSAYRFSSTT